MSRPRTATKILELKGAFKKDPQRARASEPEQNLAFPQRPPPRLGLSKEKKKVWAEVVRYVPPGVLTYSDVPSVELVTHLLYAFRLDPDRFGTPRLARLATELGKLGLNPSGRASLTVEKPKKNSFDDL